MLEKELKTGLRQTAPGCHRRVLLASWWPLALASPDHAGVRLLLTLAPRSKHGLSVTVRGESAHASESTIKYSSASSSDFDSVLVILTALACCNAYWSERGRSNNVVAKELERTRGRRIQSIEAVGMLAFITPEGFTQMHTLNSNRIKYIDIFLRQPTFASDKDVEELNVKAFHPHNRPFFSPQVQMRQTSPLSLVDMIHFIYRA